MINSSIQKSRQGLAYQDRYALLKFLEYFQQGRLREFYTDYSFNKEGNSLDIFVVLINPIDEHIFEIKTGEKFKTDKVKKLSRELHILYEFSQKHNKVSKIFLVIDPEIHAEFLQNWSDLQIIKEKQGGKWGNETYNQIVKRCQRNFGFNKIKERDFVAFIKGIEFKMEYPNKKVENEKNSPLENVIIGKIKSICEKVKSNGADIEMPYCTTMQELLETIRQGAADGSNILPSFAEVLSDSLARRYSIEKRTEKAAGVSRPDLIDKQRKLITKRLRDEYQKTTIDVKNKDSILQQINRIIQLGKYPENKDVILNILRDRELKYYFLNKLPKKFDSLKEIEFLLEELVKDERPFEVFNILKESVSEKNNDFIISFIQRHYEGLEGRLGDNLFQEKSLRIVEEIIKQYPNVADNIFTLIKQVLKLRDGEYKKFETKREYSEEKKLISELLEQIFQIYKNRNNNKKIEEIVEIIDTHFNLIGDDGQFVMYTPGNIFSVLKGYIDIDFENNFKKVIKILIKQYSQQWKNKKGESIYNGWELMGGVTGFYGHDYKVSDRHFIIFTLRPALEKYYKNNPQKAWQFIKENCITPTDKVNKNKPDFLNRASISIILERYKSEDEKISYEAFKILKKFILSRKGIPHKSDLIYQEIRGDFPDNKKWRLLKVSIDKYKLPINPFVEQIALDLAKKGNQEAKKTLKDWIRNPDYYQGSRIFERNVVGIISQFLDFSFDEGEEMFKDFINQDYFIKKFDTFETFEIAEVLNKILNKNFEVGLKIINNLSQKPKLSDNEQILLCSGLNLKRASQADKEVLLKIYLEFLDPFLKRFDNDVEKIEKKITRPQSREELVEFADALSKQKEIDKALRIVKVFIKDSNPCTPDKLDPNDPEGKYDEHKKIEQGEDTHAIATVRGWCAWVLMNCAVLDGRDYIEEIINLTEKLTKDKNYYIQLMTCFSLSQLARNRLTVMPDNKEELFFNKEKKKALGMAKRVEDVAFELLEKFSKLESKPRDVLMGALIRVFGHIRGLNQKKAKELLESVSKCREEVISESAPLFIYLAEFRQKDFKKWKWQMPGLYDDLENFDNKPFQKLLEDIFRRRNSEINSSFAWHFWKLVKESVPDKADIKNVVRYSEAFEIANRYLNILADSYDHQTFKNIYYFIQENISERFEECYKLWQKCLEKEWPAMERLIKEGKLYEVSWWPFYYNDEILTIIKQKAGDEEFLNSLEFLLDYPKEANIGEISKMVEVLQDLPSEYAQRTEKVFDKLIARNSAFYDIKEAWKKKIK